MVDLRRKIVEHDIFCNEDFEGTFEDFVAYIREEIKAFGPGEIKVLGKTDWEDPYKFSITHVHEETDDEYQKRLALEKAQEGAQERLREHNEILQYQRLHAKYGSIE